MKIERNSSCPCGSGKKYKKCCLNETIQSSDTKKIDISNIQGKITREDCELASLYENIHFGNRERKCENCIDFKSGTCKGFNLKTQDEVMDCMIEKAYFTRKKSNGEPIVFSNF